MFLIVIITLKKYNYFILLTKILNLNNNRVVDLKIDINFICYFL